MMGHVEPCAAAAVLSRAWHPVAITPSSASNGLVHECLNATSCAETGGQMTGGLLLRLLYLVDSSYRSIIDAVVYQARRANGAVLGATIRAVDGPARAAVSVGGEGGRGGWLAKQHPSERETWRWYLTASLHISLTRKWVY